MKLEDVFRAMDEAYGFYTKDMDASAKFIIAGFYDKLHDNLIALATKELNIEINTKKSK